MWDGVKGAELHLRYMSIGSSANLVIREKNRLVYFWAMTHTSVLKCRAFRMSLFHLALFLHLCLCLTTSLSLPRLSVSLALCLVVFLSLSFLLNVPPVCLSLSVLHPSLFPCLTLCLSHSFFFFLHVSLSFSLYLSSMSLTVMEQRVECVSAEWILLYLSIKLAQTRDITYSKRRMTDRW